MAISLSDIARTKHASPPRILIHGQAKVGKSSFFAGGFVGGEVHQSAPSPIFVSTEDGLNGIDTNAFPLCETYTDVIDALTVLASEDHDFRTIVIDSADWLERMIHTKICEDDSVATIELAGGGYGKGYALAMNHWRTVLQALDYLNKAKQMVVGVICHSVAVEFNDPEHEPYTRYEMKLHQPKKSTGARDLLMEWADVIGYASRKIFVSTKEKGGKEITRGVNAPGSNILHLVGAPAFVAGNRYSLPSPVDLNWQAFSDALTESTNNQPSE